MFWKAGSLLLLTCLALGCPPELVAQKKMPLGISYAHGINSAFIRRDGQKTLIGHSFACTLFTRYRLPGSAMFFEPAILLNRNVFRAQATKYTYVKMTQLGTGILPTASLRLTKKTYLKVGLLASVVFHSRIWRGQHKGTRLGNSEYYKGYNPRPLQTAVVAGFGWAVPGRLELNFSLHQYVTSAVTTPYQMAVPGYYDAEIFNDRALNTAFLINLAFNIISAEENTRRSEK